jgi:hypothetical protein
MGLVDLIPVCSSTSSFGEAPAIFPGSRALTKSLQEKFSAEFD